MAMGGARSGSTRRKGNVEERGDSLRVRYYAGMDPVTGKQVYLRATIHGTDDAAWKKADDKVAEFRTQVVKQRSATSSVPFSHAVNEWLQKSEIEDSTRASYVNYIDRYIEPAIGKLAVNKVDARTLESFYSELRRCRIHCDDKPFIEKHTKADEHDCVAEDCKPHTCKPLAQSTVRQIHSVISGALSAAERWGWISTNPAHVARRPKAKPPEPDPPTPAEAADWSKKHSAWMRTGAPSSGSR